MTRPDPNAADSGAGQDDAVWRDLVARLEGSGAATDAGPGPGPVPPGPVPGTGAGPGPAFDPATAGGAAGPDAARSFRDFDPLGLSGPAPVEPSARERLAGADAPADGPADGGFPPGPRDYSAEEDDGAFVPDEPPSLAGSEPLTVLAWLGAVGGPIALVLSAMFWRSAPLLAILGMVAAFAVSVVFLIMKLPGEKDDHDDGARV